MNVVESKSTPAVRDGKNDSENQPSYNVLEYYKAILDTRNAVAERRTTINSAFFTINSALLGVLGFLLQDLKLEQEHYWNAIPIIILGPLAGFLISLLWLAIVDYYREEVKQYEEVLKHIESGFFNEAALSRVYDKLNAADSKAPSPSVIFCGIPILFLNFYFFAGMIVLMPPQGTMADFSFWLCFFCVCSAFFNFQMLHRSESGKNGALHIENWTAKYYARFIMGVLLLVSGLVALWVVAGEQEANSNNFRVQPTRIFFARNATDKHIDSKRIDELENVIKEIQLIGQSKSKEAKQLCKLKDAWQRDIDRIVKLSKSNAELKERLGEALVESKKSIGGG